MEPFLGQIIMFGGNFAPRGWAFCDGQELPISQNTALFSMLGTIYGGDGRTFFNLPDLRGRVPIHKGDASGLSPYGLGQRGGAENVTLTSAQMPSHVHSAIAEMPYTTNEGDESIPSATNIFASGQVISGRTNLGDVNMYKNITSTEHKDFNVNVNNTGGNQSHSNIQPFLAMNYIIALQGEYPSRN